MLQARGLLDDALFGREGGVARSTGDAGGCRAGWERPYFSLLLVRQGHQRRFAVDMTVILLSVPSLSPMQWLGLVHPVLIILFVYPVVGATIRLGILARERRLDLN